MNLRDIIRRTQLNYLQFRSHRLNHLRLYGKVLILAPHPDDEVFGCGGLISRLVIEGNAPHIVILTGGECSHTDCCNTPKADIVKARRGLTRKAAEALGLPNCNIHELNFADGKISGSKGFEYEKLKQLIADLNPQTILVPHYGEGWPDHLAVRELGIELVPKDADVYEYCVWFWYYLQRNLDWEQAYRLETTSEEHSRKLAAISAYHDSLAPCCKPWIGVLPPLFIKANSTDTELYFKIT